MEIIRSFFVRIYPFLVSIFSLVAPSTFTFFLDYVIPISSTIMIGHLGEKFLAAGSLGNMIVNASGFSITLGMATALDMLCSHSFGSKEYKLVGLYTQRGMVILSCLCLPIIGIWLLTEKLLLLCNVNPEIASLSKSWVYWQMLALWPMSMSYAFRRFMLAQRIVIPQIVSSAIGGGVHVLVSYLLIHKTSLSFYGAMITIPISTWTIFILLVGSFFFRYFYYKKYKPDYSGEEETPNEGYQSVSLDELKSGEYSSQSSEEMKASGSLKLEINTSDVMDDDTVEENSFEKSKSDEDKTVDETKNVDTKKEEKSDSGDKTEEEEIDLRDEQIIEKSFASPLDTWPSFSLNIFLGWKDFLLLGFPAAMSLFLEWGSFEVNAIFVSLSIANSSVSNTSTPLAVHALLCNTSMIWYIVPSALACAATTLIGNSLGAQKYEDAKLYSKITFFLAFLFSVINSILSVFYKYYWFNMWTNDLGVLELGVLCMPVMIFYHIGDCLKCISIAVARGCGKYTHTVVVNTVSCIFIGYPISYIAGITLGYGVRGVWFGMSCAWWFASLIYVIIILRVDWKQEALDSIERTERGLMTIQH